ncbi:hypothetical protein ACXM2N_04815 [Corynebacterium sp. ZY180755]
MANTKFLPLAGILGMLVLIIFVGNAIKDPTSAPEVAPDASTFVIGTTTVTESSSSSAPTSTASSKQKPTSEPKKSTTEPTPLPAPQNTPPQQQWVVPQTPLTYQNWDDDDWDDDDDWGDD